MQEAKAELVRGKADAKVDRVAAERARTRRRSRAKPARKRTPTSATRNTRSPSRSAMRSQVPQRMHASATRRCNTASHKIEGASFAARFPGQHESSRIAAGVVAPWPLLHPASTIGSPMDADSCGHSDNKRRAVVRHPGLIRSGFPSRLGYKHDRVATRLALFALGTFRTHHSGRAGHSVEPVIPVEPVAPVAPVSPFSAGAPGAPCGPAGPGTGTTTGGRAAGTTTVGRSHALNASADNAATTAIEYLMSIFPKCRTRAGRGIAHSHSNINVPRPRR